MKDKKDIIIKVILVCVIILLLMHNCVLLKKKGKEKTPSGNVNIIEIMCEDDDKCDVTSDDGVKNDDTVVDGANRDSKTNRGTSKESTRKESTSGSNIDNQSDIDNQQNGTGENGTTTDSSDVDDDDDFTIFDSDIKWQDMASLKIFTDSVYHLDDKIAPESSNTYQFVVKNSTKYKLKYSIHFIESNSHHINMKYKLKKNDTYLVDHYVSYDELNINDQLLNSKTNDTFYLEWKWISSDNDTDIGNIQANYSLQIDVKAESV